MSMQLIEISYPYEGSSDVYEFFERFILISTVLGWADIKKVNNLPVYLVGNAKIRFFLLSVTDQKDFNKCKDF